MRTKTKPIEDNPLQTPRKDAVIAGYTCNIGDRFPMPVFSAEVDTFTGKLFSSIEEAKSAIQNIR